MSDLLRRESSFQNKQLDVLRSLERSFSSSLAVSDKISNNLSHIQRAFESMVKGPFNQFSNTMDDITRRNKEWQNIDNQRIRLEQEILGRNDKASKKFQADLEDITKQLDESLEDTSINLDRISQELIDSQRSYHEELRKLEEKRQEDISKSVDKVKASLKDMLTTIAKETNTISSITNDFIKVSGLSGDSAYAFRDDIYSIVKDLNKVTGSYYNPTEAYKDIVNISSRVTSDVDAITTMTKPLLLANETLNADMSSVATTLNRLYVRYGFSSTHMEELMNDMVSNTSGNAASAEELLAAQNELSAMMMRNAKSEDDLLARQESINKTIAWASSYGIDTAHLTEVLKSIESGSANTDPALVAILNKAGLSTGTAQQLLWNDVQGVEKVVEALVSGATNYGNQVAGTKGRNPVRAQIFEAIGMSEYEDLWNVGNSNMFKPLSEFEVPEVNATDQVEDMYVSAADKLTNTWLAKIYEILTGWQEFLGVGWSDVASLLGFGGGALVVGKGIMNKLGGADDIAKMMTSGGGADDIAKMMTSGGGGTVASLGKLLTNPYVLAAAAIGATGYGLYAQTKQMSDFGTGDLEAAYDDAALALRNEHENLEDSIRDIVDSSSSYEEASSRLLKEGLITQEELNKIVGDDKNSLEQLATAAMNTADTLNEAQKKLLREYERDDLKYMEKAKSAFIKDLSKYSWDPAKASTPGYEPEKMSKEMLSEVDDVFYGIYGDLDARAASGEEFDSATSKVYKALKKAYKDGELSQNEFDKIYRAGFFNLAFQNADFSDALVESMRGSEYFSKLLPKGDYHGTENILEDVKKNSGYASGSNYIASDRFAYLHEGEAVVPKAYNPMANMNELERLRSRELNNQDENNNLTRNQVSYMKETAEVLRDIKFFLKQWKVSSETKSQVNLLKNSSSTLSSTIRGYIANNR